MLPCRSGRDPNHPVRPPPRLRDILSTIEQAGGPRSSPRRAWMLRCCRKEGFPASVRQLAATTGPVPMESARVRGQWKVAMVVGRSGQWTPATRDCRGFPRDASAAGGRRADRATRPPARGLAGPTGSFPSISGQARGRWRRCDTLRARCTGAAGGPHRRSTCSGPCRTAPSAILRSGALGPCPESR